jgi:predicted kinase
MPKIHLVLGPMGAGKSTYCKALSARIGGIHIALDEWFARLFIQDRPGANYIRWSAERKARLMNHLWTHALSLLASGATPVLEFGLAQRQARMKVYKRARDAGVGLQIYVLDAPREVRRERVLRRNVEKGPTYSGVVSALFFEKASDNWQMPDEVEIGENGIEVVSTWKLEVPDAAR